MSRGLSRARLQVIADALSERDREILSTLASVRVATGRQLDHLHFAELGATSRSGRRRAVMRRLQGNQLIAQLDQRVGGVRAGSSGVIYTLGLAGQRLLRPEKRARSPITPSWPFLRHSLAVTELLVDLVRAERDGRLHVVAFVTEPESWLDVPGRAVLKPDAAATVDVGRWRWHVAFEVDRGTESLRVVAGQLQRYQEAYQLGVTALGASVFPRVMWHVETIERAVAIAELIERMAHPELFDVTVGPDTVRSVITGPEADDASNKHPK